MEPKIEAAAPAANDEIDPELLSHGELVSCVRRLRSERAALQQARDVSTARAEALATAGKDKEELLQVLSHELRSPLNAILGWAQMLAGDDVDAGTLRKATVSIERNTRQQAKAIAEVLDLCRIENGELTIERQPVLVDGVVTAALDAARLFGAERGVTLERSSVFGSERVLGDRGQLERVLGNVIAYSIQSTPRGGRVRIELERQDDTLWIVVEDTGRGVPRDRMDRFLPERRGEAARSSLSLAIARELTRLHGGQLRVASEGAGKGTCFTVELPRIESAAPRDPAESTQPTGEAAATGTAQRTGAAAGTALAALPPAGPVPGAALPAALPAGPVPGAALPAALPAGPVPGAALPAVLPAGTVSAGTVSAGTVSAGTVSAAALPAAPTRTAASDPASIPDAAPANPASFRAKAPGPAVGRAEVRPSSSRRALEGIDVVIVDDEPDAREVIATMLRHAGACVRTAGAALDALELVRARPPEVLVSDIAMPGYDGYELMRRLRTLPEGRSGALAAVAVTAFATSADRERALGIGFDEHLSKPVEATELVRVVADLAARVKFFRS